MEVSAPPGPLHFPAVELKDLWCFSQDTTSEELRAPGAIT